MTELEDVVVKVKVPADAWREAEQRVNKILDRRPNDPTVKVEVEMNGKLAYRASWSEGKKR